MLDRWNHKAWNLSRLASFTHHITFEICTSVCMPQSLVPPYCWVVFHCVDLPQFAYLFTHPRTYKIFLDLGNDEYSCYKHWFTSFSVNGFHFSRKNTLEHGCSVIQEVLRLTSQETAIISYSGKSHFPFLTAIDENFSCYFYILTSTWSF